MGYRIEYGIQSGFVKKKLSKFQINPIIRNAILLVMGGVLIHLLAVGVQMKLLTPRENVETATKEMVTGIRNGQKLDDAIEAFCETVSQ